MNKLETDKITAEQIAQGFVYAEELLNSIGVSGIENCQKLAKAYNNIDVFLNMFKAGQLSIQINSTKGANETNTSPNNKK